MGQIFLFLRSSPGEARESQAAEGERLGKRVRKKRKIYMDSGDEEEENQEEPEVRKTIRAFVSNGIPFESSRQKSIYYCSVVIINVSVQNIFLYDFCSYHLYKYWLV